MNALDHTSVIDIHKQGITRTANDMLMLSVSSWDLHTVL